MSKLSPHQKELIDWVHDYALKTLESLTRKIEAGKLNGIRQRAGIHKAWMNEATDVWRRQQTKDKHLQETPVSQLNEQDKRRLQCVQDV